jgi:predicted amidohydrolase YtcJ
MNVTVPKPAHGLPAPSADPWIPDERVSISDALDCYTRGVAVQAFEEDQWGRIGVGMRADLTCTVEDIRGLAAEDLANVTIAGTWLGGRPTYAI